MRRAGGWERDAGARACAETKSCARSPRSMLGVCFTIALETSRGVGLSYIAGSLIKS